MHKNEQSHDVAIKTFKLSKFRVSCNWQVNVKKRTRWVHDFLPYLNKGGNYKKNVKNSIVLAITTLTMNQSATLAHASFHNAFLDFKFLLQTKWSPMFVFRSIVFLVIWCPSVSSRLTVLKWTELLVSALLSAQKLAPSSVKISIWHLILQKTSKFWWLANKFKKLHNIQILFSNTTYLSKESFLIPHLF